MALPGPLKMPLAEVPLCALLVAGLLPSPPQAAIDVERYREQVEAQAQPLLDAELVSGLVIGLYEVGKTEGRLLFLRTAEIDWVEAVDNYAKLHAGKETYTVRDTLSRLEQRLPAGRFLRVHRSTIVNVDRVREIQPWFQGDFVLILRDGTRVTTGRQYRDNVRRLIGQESRD